MTHQNSRSFSKKRFLASGALGVVGFRLYLYTRDCWASVLPPRGNYTPAIAQNFIQNGEIID